MPFVYAVRQNEGRVELWIDRGEKQASKDVFDRLHVQTKEIEWAFEGELSWHRLDDKRGCRIARGLTLSGYRSQESGRPDIQDAMNGAMVGLEKAFTPHLKEIKIELPRPKRRSHEPLG
jgi:hypothetical protein